MTALGRKRSFPLAADPGPWFEPWKGATLNA